MSSKRSLIRKIILITAIGLVALPFSEAVSADERAVSVRQARRIMSGLQTQANIPGLSACVMIDGRIVWSEGFGCANIELRAPATSRTRYRTGSIAKPITAILLARLMDRNEIDVDAPIGNYLPDLPEHMRAVTARQLSGHMGGVRHYANQDPPDSWYGTHFDTSRGAMPRYVNDPLVHDPGETFSYSTYGYALLASVMEGATNRTFAQLLNEHVTDPLAMDSTVPANPAVITPNRTSYYSRDENGQPMNAPPCDISYKSGGGGLLSTPEDLTRLGSVLLKPGFLQAETLQAMTTPMLDAYGAPTGYGMGWMVRKITEYGQDQFAGEAADEETVYWHGGAQLGCRTMLSVFPARKLTAGIMCNLDGADLQPDAVIALANCFKPGIANIPANRLQSFQGRYELRVRDGEEEHIGWLTLLAEHEHLRGQLRVPMRTRDGDWYRAYVVSAMADGDRIVLFTVDNRGQGLQALPTTRERKTLTGRMKIAGRTVRFEAGKMRGG